MFSYILRLNLCSMFYDVLRPKAQWSLKLLHVRVRPRTEGPSILCACAGPLPSHRLRCFVDESHCTALPSGLLQSARSGQEGLRAVDLPAAAPASVSCGAASLPQGRASLIRRRGKKAQIFPNLAVVDSLRLNNSLWTAPCEEFMYLNPPGSL